MKIKVLLFLSILIACTSKPKNNNSKLKQLITSHLGEKLNLPSNLEIYPCLDSSNAKVITDYKICTFIDVSCGSCLGQLEEWKTFMKIFPDNLVELIVICVATDNYQLFEYLYDINTFKDYPCHFFFDREKLFIESNGFMKERVDFQTVLINKNDTIMVIGNPLINKSIKELYVKVLIHSGK